MQTLPQASGCDIVVSVQSIRAGISGSSPDMAIFRHTFKYKNIGFYFQANK